MGIKVFAPASIGNAGIGFDILGMALERPGDEVIVRRSATPGLRITQITGHQGRLPTDPEKNTAGVAALRFLESLGRPNEGIELEIHKKMPFGSGLGSSAASAVAGVFAVNELLKTGLGKRDLLHFACLGEQVASGSYFADNTAASLLGGIVLVRDNATLDVHRLHAPRGLQVAVVHPQLEILTREARAILRPEVPLSAHVRQTANIAGFVVGLFNSDFDLIGRSFSDVVVGPQRAALIPGFEEVRAAALGSGALGFAISGAGPSVFALCRNSLEAEVAGEAMRRAFLARRIESRVYLSGVNQEGAVVC